MLEKKFKKNDGSFICKYCGGEVSKLRYTSRNHCPYCLYSLHVDNMPGDRANTCGGLMKPVFCELTAKKGYVLVFKCTICGKTGKNISARDDNSELLIKFTNVDFHKD